MDTETIKKHWDDVEGGYKRLSFSEAKAHMDHLLAEIDRLNNIEAQKDQAERKLEDARLRFKNNQREMLAEIYKSLRKFDTY